MDLNLSGCSVVNMDSPFKTSPSPTSIKPKTGIKSPPIKSPIAFIESETATAFNPPKIA